MATENWEEYWIAIWITSSYQLPSFPGRHWFLIYQHQFNTLCLIILPFFLLSFIIITYLFVHHSFSFSTGTPFPLGALVSKNWIDNEWVIMEAFLWNLVKFFSFFPEFLLVLLNLHNIFFNCFEFSLNISKCFIKIL